MSGATMAASLPPSSSTTGRTAPDARSHDGPPRGYAPGERHHVHAGVCHEHLAELGSRTVHGVHHSRRQGVGQCGGHRQHRARAGGRGLHHHGVPGEKGGQHLVAEHRHGPVERQHAATTPKGSWTTLVRRPPPVSVRVARASATSGANAPAMPPMVPESNWASHRTLPCSRVSRVARSCDSTAAPAAEAALATSSARSVGRHRRPRRECGRGPRPRRGRAAPGRPRAHRRPPRRDEPGW